MKVRFAMPFVLLAGAMLLAPIAAPASPPESSNSLAAVRADYERARSRSLQAHDEVAACRLRCNQLLAERLQPNEPQAPAAAEVTVTQAPNPAWHRLSAEVNVLDAKCSQMAERLTDAHPDMRAVLTELERLQAQLNATPMLLSFASQPVQALNQPIESPRIADKIAAANYQLQLAETWLDECEHAETLAFDRVLMTERLAVTPPTEPAEATQASTSAATYLLITAFLVIAAYVGWRKSNSLPSRSSTTTHGAHGLRRPSYLRLPRRPARTTPRRRTDVATSEPRRITYASHPHRVAPPKR